MSSSSSSSWMQDGMSRALEGRRRKGTLRRLPAAPSCFRVEGEATNHGDDAGNSGSGSRSSNPRSDDQDMIDFSSNDYLGLARDPEQYALVEERMRSCCCNSSSNSGSPLLGATGSRLLSGDSREFHDLEAYLARLHHRPSALLCNSGYDANLTVVGSLPADCVLYDAYAHNSIHMGLRLWQSAAAAANTEKQQQQYTRVCTPFRHNSVDDLRRKLEQHAAATGAASCRRRRVVVVIESVYSMDGDVAPVVDILEAARQSGAVVVVDEAHGHGVYGGTGVLAARAVERHPALHCSIHTFGKAAGCHGAVVCCGDALTKEYLVNYGYPFIYSTALPLHSLVTIRCSYETLTGAKGERLRAALRERVHQFRNELIQHLPHRHRPSIDLLPSTSPIQALMIPGNAECTKFCQILYRLSAYRVRLFPIKSPTVPAGQERVRIILHAHNTAREVSLLVRLILVTLQEMGQPAHSRL